MGISLDEPTYPVVHPNPRPNQVLKNFKVTDLGWIAGFTLLSAPYAYMHGLFLFAVVVVGGGISLSFEIVLVLGLCL